ncbi:MAG: hypothetical protein WC516_08595 [Patescibacteria group bacterium]
MIAQRKTGSNKAIKGQNIAQIREYFKPIHFEYAHINVIRIPKI